MNSSFPVVCAYSKRPETRKILSSHPSLLNLYFFHKLSIALKIHLHYECDLDYAYLFKEKLLLEELTAHDHGKDTPRVLDKIYSDLVNSVPFSLEVKDRRWAIRKEQFYRGVLRNPNRGALQWLKGLPIGFGELNFLLTESAAQDRRDSFSYFLSRTDKLSSTTANQCLNSLLKRDNLEGLRELRLKFPLSLYRDVLIDLYKIRSLETLNNFQEILGFSYDQFGDYLLRYGRFRSPSKKIIASSEVIRAYLEDLHISPQDLLARGGASLRSEIFEDLLSKVSQPEGIFLGNLLLGLLTLEGDEKLSILLRNYPNVREDYVMDDPYPVRLGQSYHSTDFGTPLRAKAFLDLYLGKTTFNIEDLRYFFMIEDPAFEDYLFWTPFENFPLLEELFSRYPQAFELPWNQDFIGKVYIRALNVEESFEDYDLPLTQSLEFLFDKVPSFRGRVEDLHLSFRKTKNYSGSKVSKIIVDNLPPFVRYGSFLVI